MTNGTLYEAFLALMNVGAIRLPAELTWKLATNRHKLRPAFEALEEAKRGIVGDAANLSLPLTREESATLNDAETKWRALLALDAETVEVVGMSRTAFVKHDLAANDLAALFAAGIVTDS